MILAITLWLPAAWFLSIFLVVDRPLESADAILVLGGASEYYERAIEAAKLYQTGKAPTILLSDDGLRSGWNNELRRNPYFVERSKWLLMEHGVPETAIEILPRPSGDGTIWEAELTAGVVQQRGLRSLILVTSAYHTRRTLWTFEEVFTAQGISADLGIESPPANPKQPPASDWWLSQDGWRTVTSEYAKLVYYVFRI